MNPDNLKQLIEPIGVTRGTTASNYLQSIGVIRKPENNLLGVIRNRITIRSRMTNFMFVQEEGTRAVSSSHTTHVRRKS